MNVLTDSIHADLLHSLRLLFEDRYGWNLFVLHDMEWYERGIFQFEAQRLGDQVARQFLQPWSSDVECDGYWTRQDESHPERTTKRVTYAQARAMEWDLVIATLAENETGLHQFAQDVGARYGIQVGNQGAPNQWGLAEFAMLSVTTPGFTPWIPYVTMHQEFSLDDFRYEWPPSEPDLVMTRVQCIATTPLYARFRSLAALVPELRFRHYGHCGVEDDLFGGNAMTTADVAAGMRSARIAIHDKRWSDGYGHVGFGWFAVGRPVIGSAQYYADKLMGPLWQEGVTSFDIDRPEHETAALIRRLATDDDFHRTISENAARRFREVVSFAEEAAAVRKMLDAVLS